MMGVDSSLILLLVEILIMSKDQYMSMFEMVDGIRNRVCEESIFHITSDGADEMIWDIEKLIADYREAMLS